MSWELLFILLFGLAAIWFGWRVFMTDSMMRSAMSLLASLAVLGMLFFVLQAEFLAVLQIMMMATEMSIMAIFMVMYMMDPGGLHGMDMTHQKRPSAIAGILAGAFAVIALSLSDWGAISADVPDPLKQNHDLGMEVMKRSMMIFETAGVSILVAMIASTATSLIRKPKTNKDD